MERNTSSFGLMRISSTAELRWLKSANGIFRSQAGWTRLAKQLFVAGENILPDR